MTDAVLTLNAGSSSLKFALFESEKGAEPEALKLLVRGVAEGVGVHGADEQARLKASHSTGAVVLDRVFDAGEALTHEDFLTAIFDFCDARLGAGRLVAAGHRIVHGGANFHQPVRLDANTLAVLEGLDALAPLHQPHNLAAAQAAMAARPGLTQIGCFDTAFHHTLSATARRLGLPRALEAKGVRRYGFHGLSYAWLTRRLRKLDPDLAQGRVIFAHLGSGASLCATLDGVSFDTTMGFTALDGLVMGTRCGSLDPGVVLYLLDTEKMSPSEVTELLYKRSGLLGVSGLSGDVRRLVQSKDPAAAEALDLFAWRAARETCALTMPIAGLDGIVFSAGIGENAPEVRAAICARLAHLGVTLGDQAGSGDRVISTPQSRIKVWVLATDEERMIGAEALKLI